MLFLENFSMISYRNQLWEGRGRGLKGEDLISTLDVQIRYNVWSLFATGCSDKRPNGATGNWNNDYETKFLARRYVWVQKDTNI